jgi:cytochrome c biogenesis protein ResB
MGEGTDRMMKDGSPIDVRRVSGEIETIRDELGSLVAELDRRRQEAFDLGLQVRRHPMVVVVAASAAALVLGGLVAAMVRSRRQHRRPTVRARETRRALARLLEHPERVAQETSVSQKILAAIGTTVGAAVAKRLVDRDMMPQPAARR